MVVKEMAEDLMSRHVAKINDPTMILVQYPPIGTEWVKRFLMRHPTLRNTRSIQIDQSRWIDPTKEALIAWFDAFEDMSVSCHVALENIYNMDETGFRLGVEESTRVIVHTTMRTRYKQQPGRQEAVTTGGGRHLSGRAKT
jgi:hypothetical protein